MRKTNVRQTVSRRALLIGAAATGAWLGLFNSAPVRASTAELERFVQQRAAEVIAAANSNSSSRFVSLLRRYADVDEIATFVLGNYATRLPSNQHRRYVQLFEDWIGRQFRTHASALAGNSFEVINATGGPQDYVVNGRILGGGRMPVSFRMRKTGSSYRVRDVNIGGIWLTIQLRTTITQRLHQANGDFDDLFSYLSTA